MNEVILRNALIVVFQVLGVYFAGHSIAFGQKGNKGKCHTYGISSVSSNILFVLLMVLYPENRYYMFMTYGITYIVMSLVWMDIFSKYRRFVVDLIGLMFFIVGIIYMVVGFAYQN